MDRTERLALPLLAAGQTQKELWLNEALTVLDLLSSGMIDPTESAAPPSEPVPCRWYRVAPAAVGEWAGKDGLLAAMTGAGWRFCMPFEGLDLCDAVTGETWRFIAQTWQRGIEQVAEIRVEGIRVVGPRQAAVADPSGGATVDTEARAAIRAVLNALRSHGLTE